MGISMKKLFIAIFILSIAINGYLIISMNIENEYDIQGTYQTTSDDNIEYIAFYQDSLVGKAHYYIPGKDLFTGDYQKTHINNLYELVSDNKTFAYVIIGKETATLIYDNNLIEFEKGSNDYVIVQEPL